MPPYTPEWSWMPSKRVLQDLEGLEGLWVALTESRIVAKGDDVRKVLEEAKMKTKQEVTLFKVPRKEEEAHIL